MTNKFIAGLAAAVAAFLPGPALASGLELREFPEHQRLYQTLEEVGVTIVMNDPFHCDGTIDGAYGWVGESGTAWLIICQDNARGVWEVGWTPNDLDTLRHEAHHVVQDCLVDSYGDGTFSLLFSSPDKMAKFLRLANATPTQIRNILRAYSDETQDVQWREVEAFFVARHVNPGSIAQAISNHCRK